MYLLGHDNSVRLDAKMHLRSVDKSDFSSNLSLTREILMLTLCCFDWAGGLLACLLDGSGEAEDAFAILPTSDSISTWPFFVLFLLVRAPLWGIPRSTMESCMVWKEGGGRKWCDACSVILRWQKGSADLLN